MKKIRLIAVPLVVFLSVASACSTESTPSEVEQSKAETPTRSERTGGASEGESRFEAVTARSFDSAEDLVKALETQGLACDNGRAFSESGIRAGWRCDGGIWITLYDDDESKATREERYISEGTNFIQGQNWLMVAPNSALSG